MPVPEKEPPNRLLRVAIVAPSLRYIGGQSVQADLLLANWQNDAAVEAKLIPIDPPFPGALKWIEKVPFLRTLVREPLYIWSLWRGLKNVDVAHIFSASYWSFVLAPVPAWAVARLHGIPTVIHYHSGEARDHLRRFRSARPVLQRADLLVVPSGYLVDVLREFRLRALVVPNIVDCSQFSFRNREPIRPHLVCTRGFHPYYAVDVVVRAFAEIKKLYPEARLDLVGGGPLEAQIRALVDDLKLRDVDFVGVAPHDRIAESYDRADIFINGSYLDNMPVSILEAFASGTPVVSTAPEGIRRLVEHDRTGLLCEPGDLLGLAQNVIRLLRDSGMSSRIARNAREESMRYSWKEARGQWLGLYRSLAAAGTVHS
jgi:glycosyltransferase involved in cell wall biosynthesis